MRAVLARAAKPGDGTERWGILHAERSIRLDSAAQRQFRLLPEVRAHGRLGRPRKNARAHPHRCAGASRTLAESREKQKQCKLPAPLERANAVAREE